jgi:hypothetical protein
MAAAKKKGASKAVKKATNKTTGKKSTKSNGIKQTKIKVSLEQRHKMICEAAYYLSLDRTYETVNPTDDWLQAESFIEQVCTVHTQ